MRDVVYDSDGRTVATIREGVLFDADDRRIGTVRHDNVYDRNGKFIFHLQPGPDPEAAGRMTTEAVWKLLHPKPSADASPGR